MTNEIGRCASVNGSSASANGVVSGMLLNENNVIEDFNAPDDEILEIQEMNDAYLLGTDHPDMQTLLQKPFTFMTGSMYGQKDRRNTLDGDWVRTEMPLLTWMIGQDKGKNSWGLTRHPVAKHKEGSSIVLADAIGGARKDGAIKTMSCIGLDIDSGATLDDVIDKLEDKGLFALVYTSFNHGKDTLILKHDDIMRKMKLEESPNRTQIQMYLREHHKDRFDAKFIETIEIKELRKQTPDGLRTVLKTTPLDKFRVILPLWEPVELSELGATVSQWKDVWADTVTGVAVNMLDVNFDATSCDVNRLFFTPRHPKDAAEWYCAIVQGRPLRFEEIEPFSKAAYVKNRNVDSNPFTATGGNSGDQQREQFKTNDGLNLNNWHRKYKSRWNAADVIESFCADKVRVAGGEKVGTVHLECPFEHEHSSEGGTATMAMNPDETEAGYWTIFCKHDACQGRDKLEFIKAMVDEEWFDKSVLTDDEWCIPQADEDDPNDTVIELDDAAIQKDIETAGINKQSSDKQVRKFLRGYLDADASTMNGVVAALGGGTGRSVKKGATRLKPKQIEDLIKALRVERGKEEQQKEADHRATLESPDYIPLENATAATVKKAAEASKWLPSGFACQNGQFGTIESASGKSEFKAICAAFEVVYSADGQKGSTRTNEITLRYLHRSKGFGIVESVFRIGDTYTETGSLLGPLRNEGLDFAPKAKTADILVLLRAVKSEREAVYCAQSGWVEDRTAYVSPTGEVVKEDDDKKLYVLDHSMRVSADKAGTLEEFVLAADAALRGRNAARFLPGFLGGAVGCCADFLSSELAIIIANEGKAKHGKTTALKAGVSWFAMAAGAGLLITGDMTATAMEVMAVRATGAMFAPDEQGTSDKTAEEEQQGILQYAGRIGRARGRADGGMRDLLTWNGCMGVSTERGLMDRLEAEQADIRSGAISRVWTVNFDKAHRLDRVEDAAELDAYQVLAHGGVYGWAGPVFATKLLELGVDVVKARVSALENEWGEGHSGAAERVVTTGALFGVTAEIAQEAGLLPKDVDLKAMLKGLLDETLEQRAHHLDTERQALDALRMGIIWALNRPQIVMVGDTDSAHGEVLGYWTTPNGTNEYDKDRTKRTYILPVDRLGKLGVKTETGALVDQLREAEGLVPPSEKSKFVKKGIWESTPSEGKHVKSLRVSGEWVHGAEPENDADA